MIARSNLPTTVEKNSEEQVKSFFDNYFLHQITFPSNQIDAVVGHFIQRGFGELAAKSTAIVLLNQSRIENVDVFKLIDTLKGISDQQLNLVVAEVLNSYREKTSVLGFRDTVFVENFENRNIRQ